MKLKNTKYKVAVIANPCKTVQGGYGAGYVILPKKHKLDGLEYDNIKRAYPLTVGHKITYTGRLDTDFLDQVDPEFRGNLDKKDLGKWVIGFDTCGPDDSLADWSKERVVWETIGLMIELGRI